MSSQTCFIALLIGSPSPRNIGGAGGAAQGEDILSLCSRRQDIKFPSYSLLSPHSFVASALFPKVGKTTVPELWPSARGLSVICWNSYWRAGGQRQKWEREKRMCSSCSCQKSLSRWQEQQVEMQVWVTLMSHTTERISLSHNSLPLSFGFFSCFPLPGGQEVRTHGWWN